MTIMTFIEGARSASSAATVRAVFYLALGLASSFLLIVAGFTVALISWLN